MHVKRAVRFLEDLDRSISSSQRGLFRRGKTKGSGLVSSVEEGKGSHCYELGHSGQI